MSIQGKPSSRLLIVQPWFSALGHPAQSLYNTMRTLREVPCIDYLVSEDPQFTHHANLHDALGPGQRLFRFAVEGSDLKKNTRKGLLELLRRRRELRETRSVLFFDVDLGAVAKWWRWVAPWLNIARLSLLYLLGPEHIKQHESARRRVTRLLRRHEVVLCVRTSELEDDWVAAFPSLDRARLRTLPSLELPPGRHFAERPCLDRADLRFGVLGQIRRGKSIELLVPLFERCPSLGTLTVAGSFASPAEREALGVLAGFAGFEERYFDDEGLLTLTAAQDYLLVLYDQWDKRMESAVIYLAMRAGRPVVVYSEGWCERVVRHYGCGITVAREGIDLGQVLASLPLPGSTAYAALLAGVLRFRNDHRDEVLLPQFLDCVGVGAGEPLER